MMANDTPPIRATTSSRSSAASPTAPRAGYPQLTIPMGYSATQRRTLNVSIHANAYKERDLIGVALRDRAGRRSCASRSREVNPSMYRCAKTRPGAARSPRAASCNPDYESTMKLIGGAAPALAVLARDGVGEVAAGPPDRGHASVRDAGQGVPGADRADQRRGPGAAGRARAQHATRSRRRRRSTASGRRPASRGPLHGIPVLLDDTIDVRGLPTTGGSIALQKSMPRATPRWWPSSRRRARSCSARPTSPSSTACFDANMPEGYSSLGGQVLLPSDTDKTPAGSVGGLARPRPRRASRR